MVNTIIDLTAKKLSALPFIEGIVLGGSRARGTHSEDSDIDIGLYYNPELFDINAINQLATELDDEHRFNLVVPPGAWVNAGGWLVINGYHVDLILRDINRVKKIMQDINLGIVTANYQTGHPHGYISSMYRGELAISKILFAKNEEFRALKKQAETYPYTLRRSLIDFFMFEAGFSLMFVKANLKAEDKYYIAGHVFRVVSCLNQVLFAFNNVYCINEKKAIKMIESFENKPDKYAQKVNCIFEVLGRSLTECYDMAEELYNEVKQIVSQINSTPRSDEELKKLTVVELKPHNSAITIVEYDPRWPELFEREAERIRSVLGSKALRIEHVGSTSVPGLCAKPIIDILLVVENSADESSYVPALETAGYRLKIREPECFEHRMFKGPDTDINLHVFSEGSSEIGKMIRFRDWLRCHEDDREKYAQVKLSLAKNKWRHVQHYADAKTPVIMEIMERAERFFRR